MTVISRIGFTPTKSTEIKSEILTGTKDITIIIPVKDNQAGIDLFISELVKTHSIDLLPREIIIVDNNSFPVIEIKARNYPIPIRLFTCEKVGPASARNVGVRNATTNWILFTDSDCVPTSSLLTGYLNCQNGSVGYSGFIRSQKQDIISMYYEQQEILLPPKLYIEQVGVFPEYLITANCLVWREAFEYVGGFNEAIKIAGGEDIDLGFKLLSVGSLCFAYDSIAKHNFGDSILNFRERFIRYGQGNKIISELYKLDLKPKIFKPTKVTVINQLLALLQYYWLFRGYKKNINAKFE
jgi:glycosyltransferase involved in cell wall biosynthesis